MLFLQRETQHFTAITATAGHEHAVSDVWVLLVNNASSLGIQFPES